MTTARKATSRAAGKKNASASRPLDATQLPGILEQRGGERAVAGIVLHELGHLLGLDHVDDEGQLMYPEARRGVSDFAAGDLTGLVQLGAGMCVPEL